MKKPWSEWREQAKELHRKVIVLDSHVDTTQYLFAGEHWEKRDLSVKNERGHLDIPRMREGGVTAPVFAVWDEKPEQPGDGIASARRQIEEIRKACLTYETDLVPAATSDEIRAAKKAGKIAVPIAIEGGYLIEMDLDLLREFRAAGALYMTLTHGFHTEWADSSGVHDPLAPLHGGLTDFGREVVRQMNRIGMMVDVSHVSDDTFRDVMEVSRAPVIASHSCCRAVADHRRNMSDEMMIEVAASGGVVQINFSAAFLDPDFPEYNAEANKRYWESGGTIPPVDHVTPLSVLVEHCDHALRTIGADHVGFGSDFDGVACLPEGMSDCSRLPDLTASLLERGYSEEDLTKVLGENFLRVMDACQEGSG